VEEMLRQDIELERASVDAYHDVLKAAKDDVALRHMVESLIETETRSVEEIEKMLSLKMVRMKEREIRSKTA
jgi:rubrerythrin